MLAITPPPLYILVVTPVSISFLSRPISFPPAPSCAQSHFSVALTLRARGPQFLQSRTNRRTDAYGGSPTARTRLLLEVVEAAAAAWGGDASRVGVRLSPNSAFNDMGSPDYAAQFAAAAAALDPLGLAYLHVIDGLTYGGRHDLGPPMALRDFRPHFRGPIIGNCGYTPAAAAAAVAAGDAAAVAFGRAFISNPDLPARIRHGWPLARDATVEEWYSPIGPRGYTDFPPYSP